VVPGRERTLYGALAPQVAASTGVIGRSSHGGGDRCTLSDHGLERSV